MMQALHQLIGRQDARLAQPCAQPRPRAEIYAPVLAGSDFAGMRLQVERMVAHARGNAQARGAASDCAMVFSEDALSKPYKITLSEAKSFAGSISGILPKDQFIAVCFNACASDGAESSNEGFLVTSQGFSHSPKRAYTTLDMSLLVEIFGKCDFRLMEKLRRLEHGAETGGTFCEAAVRLGACEMWQGCACYEMTKAWLERARRLDGEEFLFAMGAASGLRFEYCVCRDSVFIKKEEQPTVTLVSAHGLDMRSRQSLSSLRFLVAVNDSYEGRNLLVESGGKTRSGCRFDKTYWGCEFVAVR